MDLRLPQRPKRGHKGTFGTVAIAGGSIDGQKVMLGSAAFAASAAIRSGVGLVVFLGDKKVLTELIEMVPQAVGVVPGKDLPGSKKWQAIIVGPGMGLSDKNISVIQRLLSLKLPTVIDADGLNAMAKHPDLTKKLHKNCVLTPHIKEFERLSQATGIRDAKQAARELGCTIVLKSSETLVTDGENEWRNKSENPALATGGTGDVLAGLIGGLMAQYCPGQLSAFTCASLGVAIHSRAGTEWKNTHGSAGLVIDELLQLLPEVMQKMRD